MNYNVNLCDKIDTLEEPNNSLDVEHLEKAGSNVVTNFDNRKNQEIEQKVQEIQTKLDKGNEENENHTNDVKGSTLEASHSLEIDKVFNLLNGDVEQNENYGNNGYLNDFHQNDDEVDEDVEISSNHEIRQLKTDSETKS